MVHRFRTANKDVPLARAVLACGAVFAALVLLVCPQPLFSQGDAPLIDTRSSSVGANLDSEAVENIPTSRNFADLLQVAPGVDQGPGVDRARGPISGSSSSLMTIDGIAVGNPADLASSQTYDVFDAIEEIQIQTGGSAAEYGRSSVNGVIQVVTKKGTQEWRGTGQILDGSGYVSGQAYGSGPLDIRIREAEGGGFCLESARFGNGRTGAGGAAPLSFGFDLGFSIGADLSAQTPFAPGDGAGNLFTYAVQPCPGATTGLRFVDTPTPLTPPTSTHFYFGQNGVFALDMNRVALRYGLDPKVFDRSGFLSGPAAFKGDLFQQLPGAGAQPTAGSAGRIYLYGIDIGGSGFVVPGAPSGDGLGANPYGIQLQGGTPALPDADGDGIGDSFFLRFSGLSSACPNVVGGAFTVEPGGAAAGGGYLQSDAGAPEPDCDYLKNWGGVSSDFQLSAGLRYDFQGGGRSKVFGAGESSANARAGGAFRTSFREAAELGGPIVRDKLWIWGSYDIPDTQPPKEENPPLFGLEYWSGYPDDFAQRFEEMYATPGVRSAPEGQGVQDVELEIVFPDNADGVPIDYTPGGSPVDPEDRVERPRSAGDPASPEAPLLYVVAKGGPTGEVFQVELVQPAGDPVAIDGLVALEPVAATAADRERFERELDAAGGTRRTLTAAGYCLQMDAMAPPAGTVFRVAPAEKQARYAPMRRALEAARRLREAGQLHPDSDPEGYYDSIRQWAAWTVEKAFDREGFLDAFVERTEKNFRDAGQAWSEEVAAAVRTYGEGRWTDIRAILDAAEALP